MDHPSFLEKITESTDTSQPPPATSSSSSLFPTTTINPYFDNTCAEMGFPLTTLGVSSHNILSSSTTPYLINIPNNVDDAYNISTYLQDPILFDHHIDQASEMDDGVLIHLLLAYAEAIEMDQESLAEVMVKRISQKVSPIGDSTIERLMYYMFQNTDKLQSDYLNQEAAKNLYPAFKAFYTMFPNGKLAHFAANHAIFTSLTNEIMILRIFDFDIGEGIQWAPLIEALGHQYREVVVTTIKLNEDYHTMWRFEDTKKRLCDYATSYGLMLKVEEMELSDLVGDHIQEKLVAGANGRQEFFAFNAMFGLPHMGRQRSRKDVIEFLKAAQDLLQHAACRNQRGVIIFGDGDAWEKFRNVNYTYSSFLDGKMMFYQALLETMYMNFPPNLGEARTCMECLFVAPFVSCGTWAKAWGDAKLGNNLEDFRFCLEGWNFSQESLLEAKEMVKEGESMYGVRIDGDASNEMVMDWRGIPLVRVSCWRS